MTYYCQLIFSNCPDGGYEVTFPDLSRVYTEGKDKEHALAMAKEALDFYLEDYVNDGEKINRPVDRSEEGLFPIEVDPAIAKSILESKIASLQKELEELELKKTQKAKKEPALVC